jgi:hypothetical protein
MGDYILPMGPRRPRPDVDVSPEARAAYAAQAAADLDRFYRARAAELVPGGKLLVASFGVNGHYRCNDGIYDLLNDALLDLREAGRLSREAYRRIVFPIYFRSKEELIAPVAERKGVTESAGVRSLLCEAPLGPSRQNAPEPFSLPDCFHVDRADSMEVPGVLGKRGGGHGDPMTYAEQLTDFVRAFTEPILQSSLSGEPDAHSVIEGVYQRMRDRLIANRAEYEFHYIQVAALLTRV